jgi:tryptophan synthase beta chain
MGIFGAFLDDPGVRLVGVEAGGLGLSTGKHAARLTGEAGKVGIAQGYKTYFIQSAEGQMNETHSISAGLDYVGVSPILAHLKDEARVTFCSATDNQVIDAVKTLIKSEGIIAALESAHGLVPALNDAPHLSKDDVIVVNVSGRGDKDIFTIADSFNDPSWKEFIVAKGKSYRVD